MAEGIYYYDETAPVTRSHNDVLHYQRLDQKPATYLVELPGTLPLPPPELQTQETRRGTSIVTMDQPTSEGVEEEEPLETYLRTNLASFRKSLAPEDLKDIRRARGDAFGSVLVEAKVQSRLAPPNETPADNKFRKITLNDTLIVREIQNLPPNEKSADKEMREPTQKQKPADKKERKTPLSGKPLVKEIREKPPSNNPEHRSLINDKPKLKNLINQKETTQSNNYITAMPTMTEQGGPMALKEDNDVLKYMPNEKRGLKTVVSEKDVNRSKNYIAAMPMLTEQRGPKNFEESRVKVHVMVDLLDDGKFDESRDCYNGKDKCGQYREPAHYDSDILILRSNDEGAQQRPHHRSWSANSRRESIDRGNTFGKTPISNCYNVKEVSYPNNIGNPSRQLPSGKRHNRRSRSASIMRYSGDSSLTQSTRKETNNRGGYGNDKRYDSKNDKLLGNIPSPPKIRPLKGDSRMVHKEEKSFENDSLHDTKGNRSLSGGRYHTSRRVREYGGYDGKHNVQSPKRNKADKPFSYSGMINCDIEDCPCRCHPDYDHSDKQKIGRGLDGGFPHGKDISKDKSEYPKGGRHYPDKWKGHDSMYDGELGTPRGVKGRDYSDGSRGKGYDPLYDGDLDGKGRSRDGRGRDYRDSYEGKGYDPLYDGDLDSRGRPRDGRARDYPDKTRGKGYDPAYDGDLDGKGRPKDERGRDYPERYGGKGYDPLYEGGLDGKGRSKDGRDRDYPVGYKGKGYDPFYDSDLDGKGRPKDGRDRDYPDRYGGKGYDRSLDGKGKPKDGRDRDYPDVYGGKVYDPLYVFDPNSKGRSPNSRAKPGDEGPTTGEKIDRQFDDYDDTTPGKSKRMSSSDGGPYGKTVGFRPGDNSPLRRDSTPGDGSNVRGDDDAGRKGVLKQRAPKSATTLFTHRRYHIKILDHNLQEPWFNARFSLDNEKNVDLNYQGPVKITNYYTSNRYE